MLKSLGHNLANLSNFAGRETRLRFWPYVGFVIMLGMAAAFATMVPIMVDAFAKMQRFAAEHPESVTETRGPGSYSMQIHGNHPELMPDVGPFLWVMLAVGVVSVLLLAAAVTRRLHDRNRGGFWGLMPLPFLAGGAVMTPARFHGFGEGAGDSVEWLVLGLMLNNLLYLSTLFVLVLMLAGRGTPGENRYGSQPEA